MTQTKLILCGTFNKNADLKLLMASVNDLDVMLFKSISHYYINPNLLSGILHASNDLSITPKSGKVFKTTREQIGYPKDTTIGSLVEPCFEEVNKNKKSVLLIKNNNDREKFKQMVKIIFK